MDWNTIRKQYYEDLMEWTDAEQTGKPYNLAASEVIHYLERQDFGHRHYNVHWNEKGE